MVIKDRTEIESIINGIVTADEDRLINIDVKDVAHFFSCDQLSAVVLEAEDMANLAVTALREVQEAGCKGKLNVLLSVACSRSYGLTMSEMEKLHCVMNSFDEGTDLLWGVSINDSMPMNKVRITFVIGK